MGHGTFPPMAGLPPRGLRSHLPVPGLTRSRGTIKVWSQDCLATGPQPVWPTTRLSTFSTASTSAAGQDRELRAGEGQRSSAVPRSLWPLLTGQISSATLRLGPAPEPALGGAPGQRGRRGPSRHCCEQLLTAQEADLQCPCGQRAGNTVKRHSPTATAKSPGAPGKLPSTEDG